MAPVCKGNVTWDPIDGRYSVNHWDLVPGKRSYNFRTNWNGGVARDKTGEFYFMIAGGEKTRPTAANPSRHSIKRNEKQPGYPSIRIESGKASISAEGKLVVTWENDPATLPQFAYTISVHADRAGKKGKALARVRSVTPHARQAELTLPANGPEGTLHVRLECGDILDNPSKPKVITLRR